MLLYNGTVHVPLLLKAPGLEALPSGDRIRDFPAGPIQFPAAGVFSEMIAP